MSSDQIFPSDEILKRYLFLAHEIAIRIDLVAAACDGKLNMTPPYAREYCYLQYRHICELIALGGLLLHGDIPDTQTEKTKKEWNAHRIMRLLTQNHPHAFPQSVTVNRQNGSSSFHANSKPNALTLDEFKTLYAECGEVLHRGTIKSLEEAGTIKKEGYDKIIQWSHKICDLLNQHVVAHTCGKSMYYIALRTPKGGPTIQLLNFDTKTGEVEIIENNLSI